MSTTDGAVRITRRRLALVAGTAVTTLIPVVATIRTGTAHGVTDAVRVGAVLVLTVLVFRRISWARWVLAAFYALAAISFLASVIPLTGHALGLAGLVAAACVYAWVVFELAVADLVADVTPRGSRAIR